MFDIGNDFRRAHNKITELAQSASNNEVKQLAAAVAEVCRALEMRLSQLPPDIDKQRR